MKITALASGSSGNSFLIQHNGAGLLVDAGLSCKQLVARLDAAGFDPERLEAILISHGHSDHIKGAGVMSRKFKIPIWLNKGAWDTIGSRLGKPHSLGIFETGRPFKLGALKIHAFSLPHDCMDPVGFRISYKKAIVGIATDLGVPTALALSALSGVHALIIESNHDPKMLLEGPYPWELKQRVRGRLGHLSNEASAKMLERLVSDQLKVVMLAHMSETNNRIELAMESSRKALRGFLEDGGAIMAATQDQISPMIEL
jgi:phosphoribosyl 1,2-cyclic phosphodiesterase